MVLLKMQKRRKKSKPVEAINSKTTKHENINGNVQVAVDQLRGVVEQMKLAALLLNQTSESSKEKTQDLMDHSEKTVEYTVQVSEKMRGIETSALKISSISEDIHSNSQASYEELIHSWQVLSDLQNRFNQIHESHFTLLKQMDRLVQHSQQINHIIQIIGSISQRTKILALNASIEAARAGEHGRGFSVVAKEVGDLAQQTSQAVQNTNENISIIQKEITQTTKMVNLETEQVKNGAKELLNTLELLEKFKENLSGITSMVSDSTQAVSEQTGNVQEIASLLDQISKMAINNKDNVFQTIIDLDKQHGSIEDILSISHSLNSTSDELQGIIQMEQTTETIQIDQAIIDHMKNKLAQLSHSSQLGQMTSEQHKVSLNIFLEQHSGLEAIWSNRLDGTFIYSNPKAGLVNAKARRWFKEASKGQYYVSKVYTSALTKNSCITISAPIIQDQVVIGVVGVDLSI
ncbi:methyl-accepting chemotaxis protein [Bacillus sp. 03113]|uniref:methyl-accepting chemotaxis protein n=1 Tax=Bacillus sp. 03113 TaxID=2578211 RepID=UPI00114437B3|nr:methyl-accepting chemotaxis protein [Bacillus sp. 03113]